MVMPLARDFEGDTKVQSLRLAAWEQPELFVCQTFERKLHMKTAPSDPFEARLAEEADHLGPAEDLFDAFAETLADQVARADLLHAMGFGRRQWAGRSKWSCSRR